MLLDQLSFRNPCQQRSHKIAQVAIRTPRFIAVAVYMQALASPSETAYLQRYPLRGNLPETAPLVTTLATPDSAPEAPPPAGTARDFGTSLAPQSTSAAPGQGDSDGAVLTPGLELPVKTTGSDDGPSTGVVVGGVIATIAAMAVCVAVAIYVLARRRRTRSTKAASAEQVRACVPVHV